MSEHTALPWVLCHHLQSAEADASCSCGYRGGIWGGAGEILVCEMRNCNLHEGHEMTPVGDRATQLANAALIVQSVNDRPALIAERDALREALEKISERHIGDQPASDAGDELWWAQRQYAELRRIARAALGSTTEAV